MKETQLDHISLHRNTTSTGGADCDSGVIVAGGLSLGVMVFDVKVMPIHTLHIILTWHAMVSKIA